MKRRGRRPSPTAMMPRFKRNGQVLRLLSPDECHEMYVAVNRARANKQPQPIRLEWSGEQGRPR